MIINVQARGRRCPGPLLLLGLNDVLGRVFAKISICFVLFVSALFQRLSFFTGGPST